TVAERVGGIDVSISIGSSKSRSQSTATNNTAASSNVVAGGNVTILASGAGADSDLTVQGSRVSAGQNIALIAEDEIRLLAAQNTAEQHSKSQNSSASLGISFGTSGFGVTAAASKGRGNADGD